MELTKLTLLTKEETMTSRDLSIFNTLRPFSIGFDDMFDQFENMLGNGGLTMQSNYPPYNIRKTGKDNYAIEVALAGFNKNDVEVEFEDNLLTVKTKQINISENEKQSERKIKNGEIIHKGISQRQFARSFTIAEDIKVNGAELKDGLLTVSCERVVPEYKKKKLIEIR
jgi:molecular chaperone IbpA